VKRAEGKTLFLLFSKTPYLTTPFGKKIAFQQKLFCAEKMEP
jgi:hypothetical protein